MVNSKSRRPSKLIGLYGGMLTGFCSTIQTTIVICVLIIICLPSQTSAQDTLSREDALQADLAEAVQMLENKQFELLVYDFMPDQFARDMRQRTLLQYGRNSPGRVPSLDFSEAMKNQLTGQLKAAQSGKITWNRDKSLVWIQFTTAPIEVVPAQKPGYVPESAGTGDTISGLGADSNQVLSQAIGLLESKRFEEFARGMLPIEQVVELKSQQAMDRWVHRLKQNPMMVDAMIRDLKTAQAAKKQQTADAVSIESASGDSVVLLEKVAGSFRLAGMSSTEHAKFQRLANSEIAASIIPAQKGTVVLTFNEGRWRLMAMPTPIPPSRR